MNRTDRSRRLILAAADAAFRAFGVDATTMEEIARRAGLTRKTLYNHFASREEIALRLIADVEADDAGYRRRLAANEPAADLLRRVLHDSARWCIANPSLARLALNPAIRPSLEPPPDRPSFQRLVRDVVAQGQAQGAIRSDESPNFMALVLLAVYGQAMLGALAAPRFDFAEIDHIVRVVMEGIGA